MKLPRTPYPAYKPSGVEWLEDVPAHWEVKRLKTLCSQSAVYGANISANSYTPTGVRFLRTTDITEAGNLAGGGVFLPEVLVRDFLLSDGDLLVSRSGTVGRSFLYNHKAHGRCAYAGYLVRFIPGPKTFPKFLFLYTKTPAFADFLKSIAIVSTIENVNGEKYANCPFPLPPLPEQTAIARFLDHLDRRITRYIRAKEKLIALLKEQKQVVVHAAVTGQIDVRTGKPYPTYKDSGVEWLGRVPTHWAVRRLKQICRMKYGDSLTSEVRRIGSVPVFGSNGCVGSHEVANTEAPCVIVGRKGSSGKVHYSSTRVFAIDTTFFVDKRSSSMHIRWLYYMLGWLHLDEVNNDSAVPGLAREEAYRRLVFVPPLPEQTAIARFLDDEDTRIQRATERTKREIDLLREYRTRLIADVVTGKIDVREAATGETDAPPAFDPEG